MPPAKYLFTGSNEDGIFYFKSKEALEELLGIHNRASNCIAYAPRGKNAPFCSRTVNALYRLQRIKLLDELMYVSVPSDKAEALLVSLSSCVVCGVTQHHQVKAPEIAKEWSRRLRDDCDLAMSEVTRPLQCPRRSLTLMSEPNGSRVCVKREPRRPRLEPLLEENISLEGLDKIAPLQPKASRKGKEVEAAPGNTSNPISKGEVFSDDNVFQRSRKSAPALRRLLPKPIPTDNEALQAKDDVAVGAGKSPRRLVQRSLKSSGLSLAAREASTSPRSEKYSSISARAEVTKPPQPSQKSTMPAKGTLRKIAVIGAQQSHKAATPVSDRPLQRGDAEDEEDQAEAGPSYVADKKAITPAQTRISTPDGRQKDLRGSYPHSFCKKSISPSYEPPRLSPTAQRAPTTNDLYRRLGKLPSPPKHLQ